MGFTETWRISPTTATTRPTAGRIERLSLSRPAALQFWYRESPAPLVVLLGIERSGPPVMPPISLSRTRRSTDRGMRYLRLDMKGRLIEFGAMPFETDAASDRAAPMDWGVLFAPHRARAKRVHASAAVVDAPRRV